MEGKSAVLIALDQSKAFDSIRHTFLVSAYRFFGMGDNFIKRLRTITENLTASILFEDGTVSSQFPLETGAPQGNSPSPVQYNISEQLLLLKLELDPNIACVYNHFIPPNFQLQLNPEPVMAKEILPEQGFIAPNPLLPPPQPEIAREDPRFNHECGKQTGNTEAFTDDSTIFTLANRQSLMTIKKALTDFGVFSGLKCNLEKSVLMPIGTTDAGDPLLNESGFTVADSVPILGFKITNNLA